LSNRSVNFSKTYKNRYGKKKKNRLQRKRGSHPEVNAVQKAGEDASRVNGRKINAFRVHASCVERRATSSSSVL